MPVQQPFLFHLEILLSLKPVTLMIKGLCLKSLLLDRGLKDQYTPPWD